uniref:Uncharacterized protein n=1 Tax=Ditylenchus dipsaci TaxID=166011 RepID=A0A915DCN5_9BILA
MTTGDGWSPRVTFLKIWFRSIALSRFSLRIFMPLDSQSLSEGGPSVEAVGAGAIYGKSDSSMPSSAVPIDDTL